MSQPLYIGIDIGGTSIKGVLTDREGNILKFLFLPTKETVHENELQFESLINELSSDIPVKSDIKAIGVGTAGSIDRGKGILYTSPNIPCWKNYPLAYKISKISGKKVYLENDATIAIQGTWWKELGNKYNNWIMLTLGTGLGGGSVTNNTLYTGKSGSANEFGHMTIDLNGRKCPCNSTGCLELYASATALVKDAKRLMKGFPGSSLQQHKRNGRLSAQLIYREACRKDPLALEVFDQYSQYLGIGVANLVNIFNPQAVVFAGGLSKAHRFFLPKVRKIVHQRVLKGMDKGLEYFVIQDPDRIPALGAAKIAMDNMNKGGV